MPLTVRDPNERPVQQQPGKQAEQERDLEPDLEHEQEHARAHEHENPVEIDESMAAMANDDQLNGGAPDAPPTSYADDPEFSVDQNPWNNRDYDDGHSGFVGEDSGMPFDDDGLDDDDASGMWEGFDDAENAADTEADRKQRVVRLLADLDDLAGRGYTLPKNFNHTSDPEEMEHVVNMGKEFLQRKSGVKISQKLLTGFVGMVEMVNHKFDPLGAKLDGISDNIGENIGDYDDVLWRIWQLYGRSLGEDHPLIELFVMLGLAGVQTHMLNSWAERQIDEQSQNRADQANGRADQGQSQSQSQGSSHASSHVQSQGGPPDMNDIMSMARAGPPAEMEPFPDIDLSGMQPPNLPTRPKPAASRRGSSGRSVSAGGGVLKTNNKELDAALDDALRQAEGVGTTNAIDSSGSKTLTVRGGGARGAGARRRVNNRRAPNRVRLSQ